VTPAVKSVTEVTENYNNNKKAENDVIYGRKWLCTPQCDLNKMLHALPKFATVQCRFTNELCLL